MQSDTRAAPSLVHGMPCTRDGTASDDRSETVIALLKAVLAAPHASPCTVNAAVPQFFELLHTQAFNRATFHVERHNRLPKCAPRVCINRH